MAPEKRLETPFSGQPPRDGHLRRDLDAAPCRHVELRFALGDNLPACAPASPDKPEFPLPLQFGEHLFDELGTDCGQLGG